MGELPKVFEWGPGRKVDFVRFEINRTHLLTGKNVKNDQLLDALHILTLNRDRVRNSGQFSVPNDLVFFRDRPSKFRTGTDVHLICTVKFFAHPVFFSRYAVQFYDFNLHFLLIYCGYIS